MSDVVNLSPVDNITSKILSYFLQKGHQLIICWFVDIKNVQKYTNLNIKHVAKNVKIGMVEIDQILVIPNDLWPKRNIKIRGSLDLFYYTNTIKIP